MSRFDTQATLIKTGAIVYLMGQGSCPHMHAPAGYLHVLRPCAPTNNGNRGEILTVKKTSLKFPTHPTRAIDKSKVRKTGQLHLNKKKG